jgi:syntaxin-binding protein 1
MQGFVTDHDTALNDLYGVDGQNNSKKFNDTITTMATRIATTFASLKVYYRTSFSIYACPLLI